MVLLTNFMNLSESNRTSYYLQKGILTILMDRSILVYQIFLNLYRLSENRLNKAQITATGQRSGYLAEVHVASASQITDIMVK